MPRMPEDLTGLVDVPALEAFINARVPGPAAPIAVRKHTAGYSNVTLMIDRGDDRWVMRRPPTGHLLPTAHDVMREWRFISAVHGQARVPRPVVACEDTSVIGAPFYLMERVPGTEIRESIPANYDTPAGRRRIAEEMIDALVEVHAVDWRAAGLTAPRGSYVDRQIARWQQQWELTRPRTRDLPGLDAVSRWLEQHKPSGEGEQTIAHGDFKVDNVLFSLEEQRLLAILDWELATIGDPLSDIGWLMQSWGDPGTSPTAIDNREALPQPVTVLEGFPHRDELADMYAERTGRPVHDARFYLVLAIFKGTLIGEGIYMRYIEGTVTNPLGARMEWQVPLRVERMLALLDGR
jgi:aminoglycoside phosphotransferase (APT) family kinase protein